MKKFQFQNIKEYPPFSVAISVYKNDNSEWFDDALHSIIVCQTIKPNEIVLVIDGAIPSAIQKIIDEYSAICYQKNIVFKQIKLPVNKGLGNALKIAIKHCTYEIVARMDSDDISVPSRFEQQLEILCKYPDIEIIGGNIEEFINNEKNKVAKRTVPMTDIEIKEYLKKRCPFNHVTVMYRKTSVIKSGGYKDLFWNEDYYLWIRMAEKNCLMANTGTTLVNVRVNLEMYKRRGGINYYKSEKYLQSYMLNKKIITPYIYITNLVKRFIVQILLPSWMRGWVFRKFARK